jgi:hypothetical protein
VRASDQDRQRVVTELEHHTAHGRLSLDEFADRAGRAFAATTHADLAALTHDLPAPPAPAAPPARDQRSLFIALALALATIAVLAVLLAVFKH